MEPDTNTSKLISPITAYGHPVLRKKCSALGLTETEKETLIEGLWQTMEASGGIGLAAPQINCALKAFVVNSEQVYRDAGVSARKALFSGDKGIIETFINARIIAFSEDQWNENEACLSIPGINEPVERSFEIMVEYKDRSLELHRTQFSGYTAKVIQHEYDHTKGMLFVDHLSPLKKKLISRKLKQIRKRNIQTVYPMLYAERVNH